MERSDFSYKDLPKSRVESARYQLNNRKGTLIRILFLFIPFFIPFIFWTIYSRYFFVEVSNYISFIVLINVPNIFLSFLIGVGMAGLFYSIRRLIFFDTVKINYHFFKGIKESGFEFGLFLSIGYIIYTILEIAIKMVWILNPIFYYFLFIVSIALYAILFYIVFIMMASSSLYVVSFAQAFKDAISIGFKKPFDSFMRFILYFIPFILTLPYMESDYLLFINIIGFALSFIVSFYFGTINMLSNIYDKFDIYINKITYPEIYKKGVYRDEI